MFGKYFGHSQRRGNRPAPLRTRLHLEPLESRWVLSTFNLTHLVQASGPDPFADCVPGWPYTNGEVEPQLAVDPTNPNHFVGVWMQSGLGIAGGVSFNGGNTWQEVVIPGITTCSGGIHSSAFDPWVTSAPNGDVYVSAFGADGPDGKAVFITRSTDGGRTWTVICSTIPAKASQVIGMPARLSTAW